ncbi:MAG: CDP-alcohol phosphatidyltransferase family protein [Rhodospirillales bacterium]|nr:CDP-alcohol phosphatidyltransferase family protein [Alphaproteobacteria bacterium]MBL6948510.1 CDP-alcohol phosphatidyltransferase family protein [Rhodospirillales bacterium]
MGFGLCCAAAMARGEWAWTLAGALMLVFSYVLDSCDGEIARLKNQCSEFGKRLDSFADWIVHVTFFAGLGVGASRNSGEELWLWLGLIAAAGGTINYIVGFFLEVRDKTRTDNQPVASGSAESHRDPETPMEWAVFVFRELTRADFWLIVLALSIFDYTWVLLPAGAIGAHIYWATQFIGCAREFYT